MEAPPFLILIVLPVIALLIQGLVATVVKDEHSMLERRLRIINKPAMKSFVTEHGDILDCVDINRQHAFDHPLLQNHSIQMKPTGTMDEGTKSPKPVRNRTSDSTSSQFLPEDMRCPKGTAPIKRIQKEDLIMEKFPPLFGKTLSSPTSNNVSNEGNHEIAGIMIQVGNTGASGTINVWKPEVTTDQFSTASFYIENGDGSNINAIQAGWMVYPGLYPTDVRLFTFWSKDSGKSGCYNALCPGFVQVSQKAYLGQVLSQVSEIWRAQYFIEVEIRQDTSTKNWWLYFEHEAVGYWPAALFDTLTSGASTAGWGGEAYSPTTGIHPDMGSGFQADLGGFGTVCQMKQLKMHSDDPFPRGYVRYLMNDREFYTVVYDNYGDYGNYIYFGGPRLKPK